ncbi:MAG: threonine/serine dehydratase [Acidobacteriota bacterium]|nr:threonine/serine dehydratase [Acidobacteriota bacterium]
MDVVRAVLRADQRIHGIVRTTPLAYSFHLSNMTGCNVFLKMENLQHTGSFKARGAISKLLSLTDEQKEKGIIAASTGNHGAAVAFGLSELKINGTVFVPKNASQTKKHAIQQYGTELRTYGFDGLETEIYAREYAKRTGMTYISPYNDWDVIGGQGTVGVEIAHQLRHVDAVFISVGGGGLISGVSGYLKDIFEDIRVVGCSPKNSAVMYESIKAGKILDLESKPTLSDGTSGGIEKDAVTFDLCRELIDEHVIVREEEIREAMLLFMEHHHMMIEGAAGVTLASFLKNKDAYKGQNVVLVICGANISLKTLSNVLGDLES